MQGTRFIADYRPLLRSLGESLAGKECWNGSRSTVGKRPTTAYYDVCYLRDRESV